MTAATLYLGYFTVHEELLALDIKAYKSGLEARKAGLKELLAEIQIHKRDLDMLDKKYERHTIIKNWIIVLVRIVLRYVGASNIYISWTWSCCMFRFNWT